MRHGVSVVQAEKLAQDLKDLGTRGDDELKERKGHWYLLCPLTLHEGNQATWCAGRYFEEYVKVDSEWKYKLLRFTPYFITPFDKGWAEKKFLF